jgi:hypothetical protein
MVPEESIEEEMNTAPADQRKLNASQIFSPLWRKGAMNSLRAQRPRG